MKQKTPAPLTPVFACQSAGPDPDHKEQSGARRMKKEEANCLTPILFGLTNEIC